MKEWFTTTTSRLELVSELNRLEGLTHVIFSVETIDGKVVIISYTE
jgi:hypothetical protein